MPPAASFLEDIFTFLYRFSTRLYLTRKHTFGAAILALFAATIATLVMIYPLSNWDMVAYSAVIAENQIPDPVARHEAAYADLKANVSAGEFQMLTSDRAYRIRQYEDPAAFDTMLGFYRLKLGYTITASFLNQWTGSPIKALRLISMVSSLAFIGLLIVWLARNQALKYGPLAVAFLVLADFGPAAALLTPDLFASVFLLLAGMLYIERQDGPAAAALLMALFIRPDHLAFVGVFFVFAALYGPGRWIMTAVFILSALAYFLLLKDESHPGWWVHLWFTHVEYVPTLEGFDPPFSLLAYLQMLVRSTVRSLMNQTWLPIIFGLAIIFARWVDPAQMSLRARVLLYSVFTSICAKYLVFPHFETRFYFPYLVLMGMVVLFAWDRQSKAGAQNASTLKSPTAPLLP